MMSSVHSIEIITGESFNGKEVLAAYEYSAKYLTPKEVLELVKPNETKPVLGYKYVALVMTKKANAGSLILQFTCRVEGEGKSEVATVYPSYLKVDEVHLLMIPTQLNAVDRIVVTGCVLK